MTDAITRDGLRSYLAGLAWLVITSVASGGIPGKWGSCPDCMNKGPLEPIGLSTIGVEATAAGDSMPAPPKPGASKRDRTFDLYAKPPGGTRTDATPAPSPAAAKPMEQPSISRDPPAPPSNPADAETAVPQPADLPKADADGVLTVKFADLAGFPYEPPSQNDEPMQGVPPTVRALNGRSVRVTGYMLPIAMEGGRCRQFLILRSQMGCCFGTMPQPTEWIVATSANGVRPSQDVPLSFAGILRVGATFEQGVFTGVYNLEVSDDAGH